jgi:hypothetical protein
MTTWPTSASITGATKDNNNEGNKKNRAPNNKDNKDLTPAPSLASNCSQGGSQVLAANINIGEHHNMRMTRKWGDQQTQGMPRGNNEHSNDAGWGAGDDKHGKYHTPSIFVYSKTPPH